MSFKDARKGRALCMLQVARRARVSPHVIRVTLAGEELAQWPDHGSDHWFRLFLPREDGETDFAALPHQLGLFGYVKYKRIPETTRPILRNYTVRELRREQRELDIDFVVHGDEGPASRFAQTAALGTPVALLDQGEGFATASGTTFHLLASDETGMFGVVNILRDLPRDAQGLALIEIPDAADAQPVDPPEGVEVRWLVRTNGQVPGTVALTTLREVALADPATTNAYLVGEQTLPTEGRRALVAADLPKGNVTFVGFWRHGQAQY